ncbi:MAG: hypothetical protein GTO02_18340 [Candidatus Dadabacteria bacterium]|nr:hypothetical protein [Candidatus Dadabacteria bacterium]NIQ16273.1 hypothetical protein [Candidatus Dadabacteria bacterium]
MRSILKPSFLQKISPQLKSLYEMIPKVDSPFMKYYPEFIPSKTERRYRVALLTGCVQSVFFPKINNATVEVLINSGCDVIIPNNQGCCGALSIHSGRLDEGRKLARELVDIFSVLDVDYILVNSAGCGSTMKEYEEILKDDNNYKSKALMFSDKTRDIMEFLSEIGIESSLKELNLKVTYQDACHIVHGQKIKEEPRKLINMIPGVEFNEMEKSDHCCGSAGIYNVLQPQMSEKLLEKKIENIDKTGAKVLLAANPGCLIQIEKGFRAKGLEIKTAHPIEMINWSINGKVV